MLKRFLHTLVSAHLAMFIHTSLHAGVFLVENLDDSGPGSLRQAIESANSTPGADTVEFSGGLSGIIALASDLPQIAEDLEILGPGSDVLTVSGEFQHQPFSISSDVTVTLSGLSVTNGQSDFGGGIANEGDLTVSECLLSGNFAEFSGGGIDNFGGTLVVSLTRLTGNSTGKSGFGGGIANGSSGTVTIIESTLSGNSAGFSGGAFDNLGMGTVMRSTLSANESDFGGAVENGGTLFLQNSTLSGNSAITIGGAIDNFDATVTISFSTLAGNSSATGGGIANDGTVTMKNALIVTSTTGGDCFNDAGAVFNSQGANFATDASCPGFTETTPGMLDLGTLSDNGGQTETHALLNGSVAIDAAVDCTLAEGPSPVTEDQRGVSRPQGKDCDSGAFEAEVAVSDIIMSNGFESG